MPSQSTEGSMKLPYSLKNLPATRIIFRPMLLVALGLHAIVLMLPISSDLDKPEPPKKLIKITQLPTAQPSQKSSHRSSSKPTPRTTPQPSPRTRLKPIQQRANPIISQATSNLNQRSQPETSKQNSEQSSSSKSKLTSQQSESKQPRSSQSPTSNLDLNTDTSNNEDITKVKDPLEDFLRNFPFPQNAIVGSLGVLSQDADASAHHVNQQLLQVLKYYSKELPPKNYILAPTPVTDDADLKIYQVSKGTVSQYLHLISQGENTVIFLSAKQLARDDLTNLSVETAEEREFKETLRQNINVASTKELTLDIKSKLAGGKYNDFGLLPGKTPTQLGTEFSNALKDRAFEVGEKPIDLGENGLIYSVQKNKFKGFIQLIPAEDGSGTAIISLDDFNF